MAVQGSVTATQFADLQTIAGRLESQNGIASSGYVASIFYQLVDGGSDANNTWVGGAQTSTQLGPLSAGTTSTQLNELIGKWFLGTDMPMPQLSSALSPTYLAFTAPLFGSTGMPQVGDVAQGSLGDGALLASVVDVLDNHPGLIQSMFVDDGNGTYGVGFYVNGKQTWVTVNDQLPVVNGSLVYNDAGSTPSTTTALWADLLEKAYAQLSATGYLSFGAADNAYYSINGGSTYYTLTNLTNASSVLYLESTDANWSGFKAAIIDALDSHDDVILDNTTGTSNSSGQQLLVAKHAYSVIGYDPATGDFIVRNPWGSSDAHQNYVTQFEVSMSDVAGAKGELVIDNSGAPNVVIANSEQLASQITTTNSQYFRGITDVNLPTGSSVQLASLFHADDTAGLTVSEYRLQALGDGSIQLNGAANLATPAQQAAGEIVVSAADLSKLRLTAGGSAGNLDLLVSGNDGNGWGTPADITLTIDNAPVDILPAIGAITSSSVSIAGLLKLVGPDANASGLLFEISVSAGYGQIKLNGATDLDPADDYNDLHLVKVSAADLAKLTYTPGGWTDILNVTVYDGASTSSVSQIPVEYGLTVADAVKLFGQVVTSQQIAVSDSAANIFANLDQLEQMMPSWDLFGLVTTDSGIVTETVSSATLTADRGVLSIIDSPMILDVTATGTEGSIKGLSNLATVVVFGGTASQYGFAATNTAGTFDVTGPNGTVTAISQVVALQFSDHELFVASQTPATGATVSSAQITELYSAVFSREPDVSGLNFYEQFAAANPGVGFVNYAQFFLQSSEYTSNTAHTYAQTTAGDSQFITDIYANLLHRAPDTGAVQFYLDNVIAPALKGLAAGTAAYTAAEAAAHAQVLVYISQSQEFLGDVQVTAAHPGDATHWLVLV